MAINVLDELAQLRKIQVERVAMAEKANPPERRLRSERKLLADIDKDIRRFEKLTYA